MSDRDPVLRKLELTDMAEAARVHRAAFDDALPWLARLHTPQEDQCFFEERVFVDCAVWGTFRDTNLIGVIAFREDWIDQLYVLPNGQSRGVGSRLLEVAKDTFPRLHLGHSSAISRRGASMKRGDSRCCGKLTAPAMRNASPMRSISGPVEPA